MLAACTRFCTKKRQTRQHSTQCHPLNAQECVIFFSHEIRRIPIFSCDLQILPIEAVRPVLHDFYHKKNNHHPQCYVCTKVKEIDRALDRIQRGQKGSIEALTSYLTSLVEPPVYALSASSSTEKIMLNQWIYRAPTPLHDWLSEHTIIRHN